MPLFDVVKEDIDFFEACPNADPYLDSDEKLNSFHVARMYLKERDRVRVSHAINNASMGMKFYMALLIHTVEPQYQQGIMFAARELYKKVPEDLLSSVIAFSHPGGSHARINFPEKYEKIPTKLLGDLGLRSDEIGWFYKLRENEDFIRLMAGNIEPKHRKHIPLFDTTLLKTKAKSTTESLFSKKWEANQ